MNMDKNNGSPVLNLLTGAAIGAALGLLFAPEKGEDTRKVIVKTARKYAEPIIDKVGHSIEDVYDWGGEVYEQSVKPMQKKNETGSFLLTLMLAVPVGAALGILFAPAKGSETRKKIMDATSRGLDSIGSAMPGNMFGSAEAESSSNSSSKKSNQKYAM